MDLLGKELYGLYHEVYAHNDYKEVDEAYEQLRAVMRHHYNDRTASQKMADAKKKDWFKSHKVVGMMLYVDLFSDDLNKFYKYIPYLQELGITLVHFMPLLKGRDGENDGGYAVEDYKNIDSKFGNMEDFHRLVTVMKKHGIHACIDFVVNHTAKEHEFAKRAYAGEQEYMDMYFMYDTDETPKLFEETVPEVFPGVSPGNFTYYEEIDKWVFTSFYEFQWDLNYHNPMVFEKVIDILLYLANQGVDMIRLDAIPFMWKALGTTCRNHPTIHVLLRMMKLIAEVVCPSVALLGEAIVEPEEIVKYFGEHHTECDVMYNATQMVNIWNAIATRDTRLLQIDGHRLKALSGGSWINYARCHDDIGWGFNESATEGMGFDPFVHKQFLINFYKGNTEGSFSIGELYEFDEKTMDARNCGTMASLTGLQKALDERDVYQEELAVKRMKLIHALMMASTGIPLIYSGDEVAQINDYAYLYDEKKAHDSRWLHRGYFDHKRAEKRHDGSTAIAQVFDATKKVIAIRKSHEIFSGEIDQKVVDTWNNHLYCFAKESGDQGLVAIFNFSEDRQFFDSHALRSQGIHGKWTDLVTGKTVDFDQHQQMMGPYEYVLLCR